MALGEQETSVAAESSDPPLEGGPLISSSQSSHHRQGVADEIVPTRCVEGI